MAEELGRVCHRPLSIGRGENQSGDAQLRKLFQEGHRDLPEESQVRATQDHVLEPSDLLVPDDPHDLGHAVGGATREWHVPSTAGVLGDGDRIRPIAFEQLLHPVKGKARRLRQPLQPRATRKSVARVVAPSPDGHVLR